MLPAHPQQENPQAIRKWLGLAFSHEWAEVILKKPGEDWVSAQRPWKLDRIVREVVGTSRIAGIRPEGRVRVLWVDVDRKPEVASRYWHPTAESPELIKLQQEVESCGCQITWLVSSASGGLHGVITLPEAVDAWLGHWIALRLLQRAGVTPGQGQAEVFPSHMPYASGEQKIWARSNGFRLPGQEGCKLIAAGNFIESPEAIYQQLTCDFELTENCHEWRFLVEESRKDCKGSRWRKQGQDRADKKTFKFSGKTAGVKWAAAGESQQNFARITTWARQKYPNVDCAKTLGVAIREAVLTAEGFSEFASEQTKKDVMRENGGICERWARSSLRRPWGKAKAVAEEKIGGDKHHNERLYKQSRAKLTRIWKHTKNAAELSKNKLAQLAGMNFRTLQKHWGYWVQLISGSSSRPLHTGPNNGGDHGQAPLDPMRPLPSAPVSPKLTDKSYVFVDEVGMFVEISLSRLRLRSSELQIKTVTRAALEPSWQNLQAHGTFRSVTKS